MTDEHCLPESGGSDRMFPSFLGVLKDLLNMGRLMVNLFCQCLNSKIFICMPLLLIPWLERMMYSETLGIICTCKPFLFLPRL